MLYYMTMKFLPFSGYFFCLFFCLSAPSQMRKGKISKPISLRIYGLLARLMLLYFIFRVSLKFWKFGLKNHLEVRPFFIMTGQLQEEFFYEIYWIDLTILVVMAVSLFLTVLTALIDWRILKFTVFIYPMVVWRLNFRVVLFFGCFSTQVQSSFKIDISMYTLCKEILQFLAKYFALLRI